jgi:hypothetical protein
MVNQQRQSRSLDRECGWGFLTAQRKRLLSVFIFRAAGGPVPAVFAMILLETAAAVSIYGSIVREGPDVPSGWGMLHERPAFP